MQDKTTTSECQEHTLQEIAAGGIHNNAPEPQIGVAKWADLANAEAMRAVIVRKDNSARRAFALLSLRYQVAQRTIK